MAVKLVFLGRLAELARTSESSITAAGPLGWNALMSELASSGSPDLANAVAEDRVRVAVNGALLADKTTLTANDGDEVAFLPPVSGG